MIWEIEYAGDLELTIQKVIDALRDLLSKVFGFIAKEEGWVEEETTTAG